MPEQRFAVLIGNGTYDPNEPRLMPLRCPAQDVAGLAEVLASETHGPYQVTSLVDATHSQVLEAVYDALMNQAGKEDQVLIYYSGHGKPDPNGDLYLASADTRLKYLPISSVPLNTIGQWMKQSKSRKILLVLDCCYSGAVERLFTRGEVADQISMALPKQLAGRGTYVLTASTDVQLAEEKEGDQYGLLTKHIIGGIKDGGADRDDDGVVSMNELLAYVQDKVAAEGSQSPQGYALQIEGGDLPIARTGKAAKSKRLRQVLEEVYAVAAAHKVPPRVVRAVLAVVEPDEALAPEARSARDEHVERLYRMRGDEEGFLAEMYELGYQAQTEAPLRDHATPESARAAAAGADNAQPARAGEPPAQRGVEKLRTSGGASEAREVPREEAGREKEEDGETERLRKAREERKAEGLHLAEAARKAEAKHREDEAREAERLRIAKAAQWPGTGAEPKVGAGRPAGRSAGNSPLDRPAAQPEAKAPSDLLMAQSSQGSSQQLQPEARRSRIPRPSPFFWAVVLSALFFICLIFLISEISKRSGKPAIHSSAARLDPALSTTPNWLDTGWNSAAVRGKRAGFTTAEDAAGTDGFER